MYTHTVKHVSRLYKATAIGLFVAHTLAIAKAPIINPGAPAQRQPLALLLDQLAARLR